MTTPDHPDWMTMEWIEKTIQEHKMLFGQSLLLEVLTEVKRLRLAEEAWIEASALRALGLTEDSATESRSSSET